MRGIVSHNINTKKHGSTSICFHAVVMDASSYGVVTVKLSYFTFAS